MYGSIGTPFGAVGIGNGSASSGHEMGSPFGNFGRQVYPSFLSEPHRAGEAVGYPRRSINNEKASKSIADQSAEIKGIAAHYGIPFSDDAIWAEEPGHGGDEFWQGGGGTGRPDDTYTQERYRPALTRIVDGILSGKVKTVIVLSQDRLWRDVEICDSFVKLCLKHNVRLYDGNGLVDVYTPEGRNQVRNLAIAAATYRELIAVRAPIGIKRSGSMGKVVTDSNKLGFRSGGRYSGKVIHVPAEQEMVRRIFALFLHGEERDGTMHGPMSFDQISKYLMAEGYEWAHDLFEKRGKKRTEHTRHLIYEWQIKRVLTDKRYIGLQQRVEKRGTADERVDLWPCAHYLTEDGKTVVDPALFEIVQQKINSQKRTGNAGQVKRALTGLLKCGLCGQGLRLGGVRVVRKNDEESYTCPYWCSVHSEQWCWCTHSLPSFPEHVIDGYIDAHLAPLLVGELHARSVSDDANPLRGEHARLTREVGAAEQMLSEGLRPYFGKVDADVLQGMVMDIKGRLERLRRELIAVEARLRETDTDTLKKDLARLADVTQEAKRDIIRAALRWVAILPSARPYPKGRIRAERDASGLLPPIPVGFAVFLSAFGMYHTAVIEKVHTGRSGQRLIGMRPARVDEIIGGVASFPAPDDFASGLRRAYDGRKYAYNPFEVMPGYTPQSGTEPGDMTPVPPVMEFNAECIVTD